MLLIFPVPDKLNVSLFGKLVKLSFEAFISVELSPSPAILEPLKFTGLWAMVNVAFPRM